MEGDDISNGLDVLSLGVTRTGEPTANAFLHSNSFSLTVDTNASNNFAQVLGVILVHTLLVVHNNSHSVSKHRQYINRQIINLNS